jgi:O-antigen/teichoic acid export membrane protein
MAHFLTGRLDFFLVAWALGSIGLGVYSVAVGLAEIVSRLAYELGTIIFPAVAADSLRPGQAAAVLRTTLAAAAAMAVALAAIAEPLVVGLYGSSFAGAVPVLRVLLVATVAWSAVQILWLYGCAAGRLGYVLGVLGLAAALDAGLNLLLLPRYGLMGAGIAALLSYGTAAFALVALFCGREQCTVGEALLVRRSDLRSLGDRIAELPGRARARLGL